jgi:hypothetical protein
MEFVSAIFIYSVEYTFYDHLYCLVAIEFLTADPEVPGSIPGATRFSEK